MPFANVISFYKSKIQRFAGRVDKNPDSLAFFHTPANSKKKRRPGARASRDFRKLRAVDMKNAFQSFILTFSLYSGIPMPKIKWSKNNTKYILGFFPFVGVLIGAALYGLMKLIVEIPVGSVLFAVIAVILSIILSRGVHLDGFCNTCDVVFSRCPVEEKENILKSPHNGVYAIIGGIVILFAKFACFTEIYFKPGLILIPCLGYVLSRSLCALSLVGLSLAEQGKFGKVFANNSNKTVKAVLVVFLLLSVGGIFLINWKIGLIMTGFLLLLFLYYMFMSYRHFGGIIGAAAGYFLELCELFILLAVIIGG